MSASILITSRLAADQRHVLERLLFFNANQHRVRRGIEQSIEAYGFPEIQESDGGLRIRVGDMAGVQSLFALVGSGRPVGFAAFVRPALERFVVLHVGVEPEPRRPTEADVNTPVLLKLMHGIRHAARRTRGVERIELVYKSPHTVRLHV